jgi:hypothetical protein
VFESGQGPSPGAAREFIQRLIEFRRTLPPEQQMLLDTLLIAALRPEWLEDENIKPYWAAVQRNGQSHHEPDRQPASL